MRPDVLGVWGLGVLAMALCAMPATAAAPPTAGALLEQGQADRALAALQQSLKSNSTDAVALNLECRVFFAEGRLDMAGPLCEQAVTLDPGNSTDHLWLGRVLGRQAEHAPKFSAFRLAKKVREQFELAYQLAPRSADAAADLAEFYTDAPGIVGGGEAKAKTLSDQVAAWDPELAHSILAGIAEHAKKPDAAEQQLRLAAESPNAGPDAYIALAEFYRKQGCVAEMLAALDKAVTLDRNHDDALVSAAEQLTKSGQRPEEAIALLETYLASAHQSEDAPAFRVRAQLAQLLAAKGDAASAQKEMAVARSLASAWQPETRTGS